MKKIFIMLFSVLSAFSFAQNSDLVRKISVTGNAEREIMPNMATLTFKIESKKKSLNEATGDVNRRLEKFKSTLNSRNIKVENFETISFSNRKAKEYLSQEEKTDSVRTPAAYTAKLELLVKNIDFTKVGDLLNEEDGNLKSIKKNFKDSSFSVEISESGKTVDIALNKVFDKLNSTKSKMQKLGVPEGSILVGSYEIKESYSNIAESMEEFYYVTHILSLNTKNLKDLNTIISLADDNELNIQGNIDFDLTNKDQIQSEMYNEAYSQAKQKASSILKSSVLKLGTPIIVSEDVEFQQKMIERIDSDWSITPMAVTQEAAYMEESDISGNANLRYASKKESSQRRTVDFTPKPLKLQQNISVMYEMK